MRLLVEIATLPCLEDCMIFVSSVDHETSFCFWNPISCTWFGPDTPQDDRLDSYVVLGSTLRNESAGDECFIKQRFLFRLGAVVMHGISCARQPAWQGRHFDRRRH